MTLVLGIESSCDETAAAVVEGRRVRSSIVASQAALHAPFRGVVPEIASRSHLEEIVPVIDAALREASVVASDLDAVAVTTRPGLVGSLVVGLTAAKAFAWYHGRPLVGVDHLAAHVYAATMEGEAVRLPAIALVASGGHTAVYRYRSASTLEAIGETNDDAAGEAFDKVAALLGLAYPGGPSIEKAAAAAGSRATAFAVPRVSSGPFDFSFSGLKTAVRYRVRPPGAATTRALESSEVAELAAGFERAAVEHLVAGTLAAARAENATTVLVGGGVACNRRLRERLAEECAREGRGLRVPRPALCADNAAMIAGLGAALLEEGRADALDLAAYPTGSFPG
ncbi:MAG TPA: tRNA (adenosine(37)-N6)-threonylcarbamoyltransferase complex transferase subunit TsaD [Planctomycetota bacterium]|nr:tRNA (adenosine(37)-N6)-threonylcarbamoyltransferase complex transferase subunit TsaD [Planctomycetota bacterium]